MDAEVRTYDCAVIGAGAAGLTAAAGAAALGAKTILIEAARFGGDCTWNGCIPSKSLLRAAAIAADARRGAQFGIDASVSVDGRGVLERVRAVRERIYAEADAPAVLARYHVETVHAAARFVDPNTLALDGDGPATLSARRIILATGSRPIRLDIGVPTLDSESLWDLDTLPARMLVVGGGPVAVELSQAFARLGVEVTMVVEGARILARDRAPAADIVARALREDGVDIRTERRIARADREAGGVRVTLSDGTILTTDRIFAAIGREARIADLDLAKVGVQTRSGLIAVDAACRTNLRHIFAIGDCATDARFTHVAERMATVAVMNGIVGLPARFDRAAVAWTTFTDPELAQVGPTEDELRAASRPYVVETFPYARLDRAIVDGVEDGFVSILTSRRGRVLGGTVVGARAGELIAEIGLARSRRLPLRAIADSLHVFPTYGMGVRRAADASIIRARTPLALCLLRLLRGLRGDAPSLDVLLPKP
jgi:pyruvate/2-oxoglutarate dehydrogenase complex dihydrolipoamide dehydrogenase (E3) component